MAATDTAQSFQPSQPFAALAAAINETIARPMAIVESEVRKTM
jgi:hypothetical protein